MPETIFHSAPNPDIGTVAQETIQRGEDYATALRTLDPELSKVNPDKDQAVAFDVGAGADAIAFNLIGFQHAVVTNYPNVAYQMFVQAAEKESGVLTALFPQFPPHTRSSDLAIRDFLDRKNFSPRLLTMLRMAPRYFSDEKDPGAFLKTFVPLAARLKPGSLIVLSALDDHPDSRAAFTALHEQLEENGIPHTFYLDSDVPSGLVVLGTRILAIKGKES